VSHAISTAGLGDGDFRVGSVKIRFRGGEAPLPDGTLAGTSGTRLDRVRYLHGLGRRSRRPVAAATAVPARLLVRDDVAPLRPDAAATPSYSTFA
jgi:N-acetylglucosamine-6-phosphate deacetylase